MKTLLSALSTLEFKKDRTLLVFAVVLTILAGVSVWQHWATWKESTAFLMGALALPGLFGRAKKDDDGDSDGDAGSDKAPSGSRMKAFVDPPSERRALAFVAMLALVTLSGCGALGKHAKTASDGLDAVQKACIIANAFFPESKVAEICGIAGPFIDPMRELLSASRAAGATRWNAGATPYRGVQPAPIVCAQTDAGVECWESPQR